LDGGDSSCAGLLTLGDRGLTGAQDGDQLAGRSSLHNDH